MAATSARAPLRRAPTAVFRTASTRRPTTSASWCAEPLATVRIGVVKPGLGWTESPAGSVFADYPAYQELARESFVEASRLCFAPQARRDVLMRLLGNMAALSSFYQSGWLAACPRQEHASIYQRLFGFRPLAEPRKYFGVDFETQLLGIRREELREHIRFVKPMMAAWDAALGELYAACSAKNTSIVIR
jgi:N-acyl amino acid synthase FeeM